MGGGFAAGAAEMPLLAASTTATIIRQSCSREVSSILHCMAYTTKASGEGLRALEEAQSIRALDVERDRQGSGMAVRA